MAPELKDLKKEKEEKACFILDEVEDEAEEVVIDQGYTYYDCC